MKGTYSQQKNLFMDTIIIKLKMNGRKFPSKFCFVQINFVFNVLLLNEESYFLFKACYIERSFKL